MKVTKVTIELDSGLCLEVGDKTTLSGLTIAAADVVGKMSTPDDIAAWWKAIGDEAIAFLQTRKWR